MIAYRESDVILSWTNKEDQQKDEGKEDAVHSPKICDYIRENGTAVGMEEDDDINHENEFLGDGDWQPGESIQSRIKRQATGELYMDLRQTRCPLLLVADYRFFSEMGGGSSKTTVNYLISLIDRVHKIYEETVWRDTPNGQGFSGMGFIIKKIVVHRKPTEVRQNEQHYNMKRSCKL